MASSVIISAPNAVLGIPRDVWGINSGVTEATDSTCSCTGWVFDHGDGVKKVFELPSLVSSLTALYRRDWQGTVALSASARTNGGFPSQPMYSQLNYKGNVSDVAAVAPFGGNAIQFPAAAVDSYAYIANTVGIVNPIVSVFVRMDDGGVPEYYDGGTVGNRTLNLAINTGGVEISTGRATEDLGNGLYRCYAKYNGAITSSGFGVRRYASNSPRGFTIMGYQIEASEGRNVPTPYIPTTTAPVTVTDYAATGNTITLAEAPLWGSDLSVDADLVPHSCLHGGE